MSLLGETVRTRREERGFDQEELAAKLGVSQQTVSRWEKGTALPRPGRVQQLAEALGLEPDRLFRYAGYLPEAERSTADDVWHQVYARMSELTEPELMLLIDRAWEELRSRKGLSPPGTV